MLLNFEHSGVNQAFSTIQDLELTTVVTLKYANLVVIK